MRTHSMTSSQTFKVLAVIYRKIHRLGFSRDKSRGLADSLDAIAALRLPGSAGAVLTGLEAQGTRGRAACEELIAHLHRLGVQPAPLAEAAQLWQAVQAG